MANHKQYLALMVAMLLMFSIIAIGNLQSSFAQAQHLGKEFAVRWM